jgi:hypothetical protein
MLPCAGLFGEHVNMQMFVRMVLVRVQMLMHFDLAGNEADQGSYSREDEQPTSADVKHLLPARGEQVASEVAQHSSDDDDDRVRAGKPHRKPYHPAEVVLHRDPEGGNGREVVGADTVYQSGDEDGEQEQHQTRLDFTSRITLAL